MRAFLALLVFVLSLAITERALAYTPPEHTGHITDPAGQLTAEDHAYFNQTLESYRLRTTNEIAVFLPVSLEGETIEDVGIATGRAWKLGVKGKDNGVLLVIAPVERRARIEVGKGIEGALTDLQSNDILHGVIGPRLAPGREDYRAAVDDGCRAIISALDKGGASGGSAPRRPAKAGDAAIGLVFLILVFLVPFILFIMIVRLIARAFSSNGPSAGRGWVSGGAWSNDSSWSSSSNDSSWGGGGGGGGGSDFSGGGGDFGGGGSSDSF
jgi:uncharacterized protein